MYTFIEGSPARHSYFMAQQKEFNPRNNSLHFVGLSNTRWNAKAKSLKRLCEKTFYQAAMNTIKHVTNITSDGTVRGTANGLLLSLK